MSKTSDQQWFLRTRGRVTGPYSLAQLQEMRKRGRLARFDEISADREEWNSATELRELFAAAPTKEERQQPTKATGASRGAPGSTDIWHYEHSGTRIGPVSFEYLRQLYDLGELKGTALIWQPGMSEWTPAKEVMGERRHTSQSGSSRRLRNNPFAMAGLATAVISFVLLALKVPFFPLVALIGLVLSVIALFTFDTHKHKNKWMAYVALLMGLGAIGMVASHLGAAK